MSQQLPSKIEPFVVLTTVSENDLANKICSALEDAGIPVLIEHLEKYEDGERQTAYRLLAPPKVKQAASRIVNLHLTAYETKMLITARPERTPKEISEIN